MDTTGQPAEIAFLRGALRRWDAHLRTRQSVLWLPRGLLIGLVLAVLLAGAARLRPLLPRDQLLLAAGLLALAGAVITLLIIWMRRRHPLELARRFDHLFGLKERVSAALQIAGGVIPAGSQTLAQAQLAQTVEVAARVQPEEHLPLRWDRRAWLGVGIVLGVLALLIFLPNPQEEALAAQAEVEQAIAEQVEELERLVREVEESAALSEEQQQEVLEVLQDAIRTLEQPDISQAEAVAALDAAEQELRDLSEQFAAERQEALEGLAEAFEGTPAEDIAEALEQGDLLGAAEALASLDLQSLTPEELAELAQSLEEAADALEGTDPELAEALREAAAAIQSGDLAAAEQALQDAAGQMAGDVAEVDELAEAVGKGERSAAAAGAPQPGQGQMGQAGTAQGSGGGQQEGGQQEGGIGSGGAGRGEGDGPAQGGQAGGQMPTDNGPGDGGLQEFEELYAPQRIGGEGGEQVDIPGSPDPGMPTGREGEFAQNPTGSASVPYNEVYADYAGSVNEALDSGYVPLGLRDLIRTYFSRLDPGG
ncbi:MAG: hypothetical protein Kow00124_21630 [Anaerolineae bacterium]